MFIRNVYLARDQSGERQLTINAILGHDEDITSCHDPLIYGTDVIFVERKLIPIDAKDKKEMDELINPETKRPIIKNSIGQLDIKED